MMGGGAVKQTAGNTIGKGKPGPGRPKGVPNKKTAALKEMILQALDGAHEDGGVAYLKDQAEKNPTAFLTLVGKVLPLQLTGEDGGAIQIEQKVKEDADVVTSAIAGLAQRARAAGVAGATHH